MKKLVLVLGLILLGCLNEVWAQSVYTTNEIYRPKDYGYEMDMFFDWKFIDCSIGGGINLGIRFNLEKSRTQFYIYKGESYNMFALHLTPNLKGNVTGINLGGAVYEGSYRLGYMELKTVLRISPTCLQNSYDILKPLSIVFADYKSKIDRLVLDDLTIKHVSCRDYDIERKIEEYLNAKKKVDKAKEHITYAESLMDGGEYSKAITEYTKGKQLDPKQASYVDSQIEKLKEKIDNDKKESKFDIYIESGDKLFAQGDFKSAIISYKNALKTEFDNNKAQTRLRDAQNAEKDRLAGLEEKNKELLAIKEKEDIAEKERREAKVIADQEEKDRIAENERLEAQVIADQEEKDRIAEDEIDAKYNQSVIDNKNWQVNHLKKLKQDADRMRANGLTSSLPYKRTIQSINELEKKLGITGMDSYSFKGAREDVENSLGKGFGSGISSIMDAEMYFRFSYGIRELETGGAQSEGGALKSSVDVNTLELGVGKGNIGLFLGGGFPHSELNTSETEAKGFTWFGGLEYTVYKHRKGYDIGLNIEYGSGSLKFISERNDSTSKHPSSFYSIGAQVTLFKFFFISYNYGFYSSGFKLTRSDGTESDFGKVKGEFSKIGVGLKFDFGNY